MNEQVNEKAEVELLDPAELVGVAMMVDSARHIIDNMRDDFFEAYHNNEEEHAKFVIDNFKRKRAVCFAVAQLLFDIDNELKELGVER